jgi:hypothetical protein
MLLNLNLKSENYADAVAYQLRKRIQNREMRVGIIGLGYVGLPLAIRFLKEGFTHFYLAWIAKLIMDTRGRFDPSPKVIKA